MNPNMVANKLEKVMAHSRGLQEQRDPLTRRIDGIGVAILEQLLAEARCATQPLSVSEELRIAIDERDALLRLKKARQLLPARKLAEGNDVRVRRRRSVVAAELAAAKAELVRLKALRESRSIVTWNANKPNHGVCEIAKSISRYNLRKRACVNYKC